MALRHCAAVLVAGLIAAGGSARAQSLTEELSVTAGGTTEDVGVVGTQVRVFGDLGAQVQMYLEAAWASRSGGVTDAFGAAYPYDNRLRLMETYVERTVHRNAWLVGARAGRYRTPFGISGRSDYAYTGFLRAPLIRYDNYFGLSNNFLEGGVDIIAGMPSATVEVSLGVPQDVGAAVRQSGFDRVVRVQAYHGSFLIGASHMRSRPYDRRSFVAGDLVFTGVDVRWMLKGVQLRGEFIKGTPFSAGPRVVDTTGWYIDGIVHRPAMGPLTLVARVERLDYSAGTFSRYGKRFTAGARVELINALVLQVNAFHQPISIASANKTALDVGITYVIRHPR